MKMIDLFSGIGGFHLGLEQSGFKFDWVGFSEIDKYASKQYKKRFSNAEELGDITNVRCEDLPKDIDILCGGFPCQAFSIAGKRKGFDDTRGTLFFEIARILRYFKGIGKPIPYFILENVKGLLNHENGRTFATIYRVLADLDYTIECQILNTRWFLPQNRERIYIVGYIGEGSGSKVFPVGKDGKKVRKSRQVARCISSGYYKQGNQEFYLKQIGTIGEDLEATRVYDTSGCARTIKNGGGMGAKTGLYQVKTHNLQQRSPDRPSKLEGQSGGSGHLSKEDGTAYCLESHNLQAVEVKPILTPNRGKGRQNGRRFKEDGEDMFTLTAQDQHGVMFKEKKINKTQYGKHQQDAIYETENSIAPTLMSCGDGHMGGAASGYLKYRVKNKEESLITRDSLDNSKPGTSIRRLTPTECERLQGFPDGWTEGQSDTQRYKQLGNAVSVPVVRAIGKRIKLFFG